MKLLNLSYNFKTKNKMKKLFLIAGIALMSLTANAQDGLKGTWWVGGQLAFGSNDNNVTKTTSNTILPVAGYFIAPTTTVGLGIGVINGKTETTALGVTTTSSESSTFVVQPLVRKYWSVGGKFFFFGQASLPIMLGNNKISDAKTTTISADLAPGFDFLVNKWMTVETSFSLVNIASSTEKPATGDSTSSFSFDANPFDLNKAAGDARSIGGLRVGVKFLF